MTTFVDRAWSTVEVGRFVCTGGSLPVCGKLEFASSSPFDCLSRSQLQYGVMSTRTPIELLSGLDLRSDLARLCLRALRRGCQE